MYGKKKTFEVRLSGVTADGKDMNITRTIYIENLPKKAGGGIKYPEKGRLHDSLHEDLKSHMDRIAAEGAANWRKKLEAVRKSAVDAMRGKWEKATGSKLDDDKDAHKFLNGTDGVPDYVPPVVSDAEVIDRGVSKRLQTAGVRGLNLEQKLWLKYHNNPALSKHQKQKLFDRDILLLRKAQRMVPSSMVG